MTDRNVNPDECLLQQIFTTNLPNNISIFLQDWDKCVFRADFSNFHENVGFSCVVRLEAENGKSMRFAEIAAMQQIAETIIPELVPRTISVGKASNANGRIFDFSVIELVKGDMLEDVWDKLNVENQRVVAAELAEAVKKLHSARLSDLNFGNIVDKILCEDGDEISEDFEQPGLFGGPHTGFLNEGSTLLGSIMGRRNSRKPSCTMKLIGYSQDTKIQSIFRELGSVGVKKSDMDNWAREAVLCHNDLTPRNLIIQQHTSLNGKTTYKLAGIIDWELAGFYPPSYELSLQDTYLGSANRHLSFYLLLKENMKKFVPPSSSQIVLLQAMELIFESQQRSLTDGSNVGAHIRKRFFENSRLDRDEDYYGGWTRKLDDGPWIEYSRAAFQKLEEDVIEEMVARRNSNAD